MSDRSVIGRLASRPYREGDQLPAVGSQCLASVENCDVESDQHRSYSWRKVVGYTGEGEYKFVCFQVERCWPTVHRLENCWFAEIPTPITAIPVAKERRALEDLVRTATEVHRISHRTHDAWNALAAALDEARAVMTQPDEKSASWRSMDSAPRDGREVLLKVELRAGIPGRCLVGHHMAAGHCIQDHPAIDEGWYFWNGRMFDRESKPIAWMPLPDVPPHLTALKDVAP